MYVYSQKGTSNAILLECSLRLTATVFKAAKEMWKKYVFL